MAHAHLAQPLPFVLLAACPPTHLPINIPLSCPFHRYGCLIGFVVLLTAGILANMPGLASPALVLCLVLLLVAWALVGASTAALKVGNDG